MRRTPRTRWEKGKGASSTSVGVALYSASALESGTYQYHMRARLIWVRSERGLAPVHVASTPLERKMHPPELPRHAELEHGISRSRQAEGE